ncbi:unnamed protein product [Amoebophrya sp. A25]|nr:unnamed protein product [Amoebophrya sp. A25]|eukprot:GSA25T00010653001.1
MRHGGLDIESVGSARDTPSDERTPSDECGDSPGKDAEADTLLRRKRVSGKEQRDLGSVPSAPPPSLKDQRGKETGGKKDRPRFTCDKRCCAFSWCRVGTITTILFLFSACLYFFYHDAVLEFLGEKGSLIGQFYPFAAEPSSSTLQTSKEEVANNCGSVTCGKQETGGSSSTASSSSAAAEEKAADQKAVGTSSTSTIGNGAADPSAGGDSSTGAADPPSAGPADPSTVADSSTGAADPSSAGAADHSSDHVGTSDHSTTDLHSTEPGADKNDPRAGENDPDENAVGTSTSSTSTIGNGAADSSTGAADSSTGAADSSTGAADSGAADHRHRSDHGTSDHSTTDLHSSEHGADISDPGAGDKGAGAGDGSRTCDTTSKKRGEKKTKENIAEGKEEPPRTIAAEQPEVSPPEDLTPQEGTLDEDSLVDLDCLTTDNCKAIIRHPENLEDLNASGGARLTGKIGIYMCPGPAQESADRAIGRLFAGQKIRPPITCATFTKKFINDAANHHWNGKESSTTSPMFGSLDYDETLNGRQINWVAGVTDDDVCCRDRELYMDDSATNWPPIFNPTLWYISPGCIPNPRRTCQWILQDGSPPSSAGDMLCGRSHLVKFWNRLGNILFPAEPPEETSTCDMITKGFVDNNLLGVPKDTPKSKKVHDWFAKQPVPPSNKVPVWSPNPAEDDHTVCCVNAAEEEERKEVARKKVLADALQCVPIKGACMVKTRTSFDSYGESKEVGEFVCRKSLAAMQNQVAAGIRDCASITRKLIDKKSEEDAEDASSNIVWRTVFGSRLPGSDDMLLARRADRRGLEWSNESPEGPHEKCCETTQKAIERRAEQLSQCVPTKLCKWSVRSTIAEPLRTTEEPAGKALCGLEQDAELSGKVVEALFPDDLTYSEGFACSDITKLPLFYRTEEMEVIAKAHGWSSISTLTREKYKWSVRSSACCMSKSEERVFEWIDVSTNCVPVEEEACKLKKVEQHNGEEFYVGKKLCHASSSSPTTIDYYDEDKKYKELERLARGLFSENQGQGELRCDTITRKFLETDKAFNAMRTALGNDLTWIQNPATGDAVCCKSREQDEAKKKAAEEKKLEEAEQQKRAEESALKCFPIEGKCMITSQIVDPGNGWEYLDAKPAGLFFCDKISPVMQQPGGVSACEHVTRRLINEMRAKYVAGGGGDSAWARAFKIANYRDKHEFGNYVITYKSESDHAAGAGSDVAWVTDTVDENEICCSAIVKGGA